jgi:5-methylcytosine-specific restriction enzyme subunit McrC
MTKDKSILIRNIYYMLSYAFTTLNQGGYENVETEEFENLHNLFAAILAKGIGRQLKQGLYREYLSRKEDLAVVRGKIDMPGSIKHRVPGIAC